MKKLLLPILLILCSCEPPKPRPVDISGHRYYVLSSYKVGLATIHDPECPKCKEQHNND